MEVILPVLAALLHTGAAALLSTRPGVTEPDAWQLKYLDWLSAVCATTHAIAGSAVAQTSRPDAAASAFTGARNHNRAFARQWCRCISFVRDFKCVANSTHVVQADEVGPVSSVL